MPQSSIRSFGIDPEPYLEITTGERSSRPHYVGWSYMPRPEFTHTPLHPNRALIEFREAWDEEQSAGNLDLGEFAESYARLVKDRFARRVIRRIAVVMPRPLAERAAACERQRA